MDKIIRVGLIGFGVGGHVFHAPVLTTVDGLKLTKIRASKPEQVALAHSRYPDAAVVENPDDIINDPDIDLVVISTPNTSHFPLGKQALEAGKHVVLDKPFTIDTADADALIALARQHDRLLSVYHNRRFDGDFLTIQKIINAGLLGEIAEVEIHYDRFRNYLKEGAWREEDIPGAGLLYDLGSHLIDQALTLMGMPKAVTADLRAQRKAGKVVDNFELILHYTNTKVTLKAGMLVREPLPRYIVLGDKGSFVKYGIDVQEEALKAGFTSKTKAQWGVEPADIWGRINTDYNGLHIVGNIESEVSDYANYYKNVYNALLGKEELQVTALQARNVIRIIEIAMISNDEKRTITVEN